MRTHLRATATILVAIAALGLASPGGAAQAPHLQDQTGHRFTLASLRGTPLVLTFVAAHCTDACPLVNAQFAMAQRQIQDAHLRVRLLTVTLDPEHDSAATMRHLANVFSANPHNWLLASGNVADVHAIMTQFKVIAERGERGYADVHTTFVYFIDTHGRLRKTIIASTDLGTMLVAILHQNWRALAS
ncbi:MAG TPA: SCO family protein [Candidatus Baltobacteraceae bacterium]|jgi:protein SCO1/2